ncbi:MAG: phosphoribosylaminoimidazolecarboxamide formyltransferase / cyclohydrolase, partial [Gaiellaceae bacterium]|nr:phosphoribosylaminoimidazolecarboxamide formyltransferase / cyclohydrolase [Gaiellaceae bacterium]
MSRRALISVYDKTGLEVFATGLAQLGFELVASGGSAEHLRKHNLAVTTVEEVTETPELLGGQVKTLHPTIHAGILARRENADDVASLEEHSIEPFDLVCVNFYPFAKVVSRYGVREEDAVEMIDIGGPS